MDHYQQQTCLHFLYFEEMNGLDPKNPNKPDRDRFVLSKGHAAPGLYGVLAEKGFIPKEDLTTLRKIDSYLQGHPDMKHTPGVDMSAGSSWTGNFSSSRYGTCRQRWITKIIVFMQLLGDGEIRGRTGLGSSNVCRITED